MRAAGDEGDEGGVADDDDGADDGFEDAVVVIGGAIGRVSGTVGRAGGSCSCGCDGGAEADGAELAVRSGCSQGMVTRGEGGLHAYGIERSRGDAPRKTCTRSVRMPHRSRASDAATCSW